jgi:hypothetical protein
MASGITKITDVVVPERFTSYVQQLTEEKSRMIQSGAVARDSFIDQQLAGGGLTFNVPSFRDLDNDADNVGSDDDGTASTPNKIQTSQEIAVRLSRNSSWSDMDLTSALAGADPLAAIGDRVAYYWTRRLQAAFVATLTGLFADNAAAPAGTEHVQNDLTNDVSGASYVPGVTDLTAEALIDTLLTAGDSMDMFSLIMVHSVVKARMKKNNLIDTIPDARGEVNIDTFQGLEVIVDDHLPVTSSVYESWIFGTGAVRLGVGSPDVPTETIRVPAAGNGAGQETLHNRVEWAIHPTGHKFAGTPANGGPSNAATSNNLAHASSWERVFPERKQIRIARLITREA